MAITRAPKTIVVYDLTGQADFTIPFDYLARKFVAVTLIGADRKTLVLNTDYRFTTKTQITLNVPSPVGYESVEIRRFTSATDHLVNFHDGSILRAYDLNLSQIQTLHVAEEARDLAGDSIGINDEGNLDARGRKIVNLGDAVEDNDAVNLSQLRTFDTSTANNADRAAESERQAKASETVAIEMERLSGEHRDAASQSQVAAKGSADNAHESELAAAESARKAKVSEGIVVPIVPIVEADANRAEQARIDAEQAVMDVKDLGAVPVGTIAMFGHKAIPAGYIDLCVANPTFSVVEFPELAKLYPDGRLPSYLNRYPKGYPINTVAALGAWMIPEHTHAGNTADFDHGTKISGSDSHSHTRGSMEITGSMRIAENLNISCEAHVGAFYHGGSKTNCDTHGGGAAGSRYNTQYFKASRAWSGSTSSDSHNHTVTIGKHKHTVLTTGIRESFNKGQTLDVDHTGTTFAIKAAGAVANDGLMEVVKIKEDVEALKAADVVINERIDSIAERPYVMQSVKGRTTDHHKWWYRVWSDGFIQQGGQFFFKNMPKDQHGASQVPFPKQFTNFNDTVTVISSQQNCTSTYHWRTGYYDSGIRGKFYYYASGEVAPADYSEWITWSASGY